MTAVHRLINRLADRLGYERKRPRIPGSLIFTNTLGTWRTDGYWDGDAPRDMK